MAQANPKFRQIGSCVARGLALPWAVMIISTLTALTMMAVDYGRVTVAQAELQAAADAAARFAATGLADGTHISKAQTAASQNTVYGTPVSLSQKDVVAGTWDSTQAVFTAGGDAPNAIRITARRTAATGNALPLILGQLVGRPSHDIVASSVVRAATAGTGLEVFGIKSVELDGGSSIRRVSGDVEIGSGGSWEGPLGTMIHGNIHFVGNTPSKVQISGKKSKLESKPSFADAVVPKNATQHKDIKLTWTTYSIGVGHHVVENLSIGGSGTLAIDTSKGDVRVYVTDELSITGAGKITVSGTGRVEFHVTSDEDVELKGSGVGRGALYANQSEFEASGAAYWQGTVIAESIELSGSARIIADPSFPVPALASGAMGGGVGGAAGVIAMVD